MILKDLKTTFSGKRVFLTGHTGFKGTWLLQILHRLGAVVKGFSLPPEHPEDLYNEVNGDTLCYASVAGDVRDAALLKGEIARFQPHFIFHLAAQALVRRSYREPVDTFAVNVLGTAHVLDAMRALPDPAVGVMITTDKVYQNDERGEAFPEDAKLGGHDPYSASKAAAEIVIDSYRRSFFNPQETTGHRKVIAALRAGNVIGGGDWSEDRLIPDLVRALRRGEPVTLRNPASIRPWQHVLEPLSAYLQLAALMAGEGGGRWGTAYNIGPDRSDERTVSQVVDTFYAAFGKAAPQQVIPETTMHEAGLLMLDNAKLKRETGWRPKLNAEDAIRWTAEWYADRRPAPEKCSEQIAQYFEMP